MKIDAGQARLERLEGGQPPHPTAGLQAPAPTAAWLAGWQVAPWFRCLKAGIEERRHQHHLAARRASAGVVTERRREGIERAEGSIRQHLAWPEYRGRKGRFLQAARVGPS